MTTYTAIPNGDVDQDSPVTQPLLTLMRDNPIAAFEGDATAVAAGVTLKDPALDTGAATAAGTTWVGLRTAGLGTGAVGSYALLTFNTFTTAAAGTTHAGSGLRYTSAGASPATVAPSGTWRLMGQTNNASALLSTSVFLRIS